VPADRGSRKQQRGDQWLKMDAEFLKKFPVKLHPDVKMTSEFVALFIAEEPQLFQQLQNLLHEEMDLIEVMRKFNRFLTAKGFDSRYSEISVFGALCDEAKSAAKLK
jgi:hypothetical protein